jgi:pimeloyl-ACP methyl ester carboxylesterase
MPTIKVNDINIYYEIHGEGFPLIDIMGLAGDVNWWLPEIIEAHSQNFKTIIFDNRGAGRTDKPDFPYSIAMMADDTIGLMDALNIEKAHILGASLGGMIAQEIAINHPERAEKLVLCCTHCGGSKQVLPSNEVLQKMMTPQELPPEEFVDRIIPLCYTEEFINNNPDFIESYKKRTLQYVIPYNAYLHQIEALMGFSSGLKLKRIKAPTLIVHGKEDMINPWKNAEILANRIPNAEVIILDNAAHLLFKPNPKAVIEPTIEFLTKKIEIEAQ